MENVPMNVSMESQRSTNISEVEESAEVRNSSSSRSFLVSFGHFANFGAVIEYPATSFIYVGVLWRTRYITIVAFLCMIVKAPAMQVNNVFTVNFIFCPLKANTWRLENMACNRNEPKQSKQCINAWQITEASNSTKRHADNSGNQVDLWPIELIVCHNTT